MKDASAFIAELIREANRAQSLSPERRRALAGQASVLIRALRAETGIRQSRNFKNDELFKIEVEALRAEIGDDAKIREILMRFADMIRTLKIILDGKE